MTNKYTLSNETIRQAIRDIPKDKWGKFCNDLYDYMVYHSNTVESMKVLSELGLIEFEEPKVFTWADDGEDSVTISLRDGVAGDIGSVVFKTKES